MPNSMAASRDIYYDGIQADLNPIAAFIASFQVHDMREAIDTQRGPAYFR